MFSILDFGDTREDGTIDDIVTTDNKDRNKILSTVAKTVFDITQRYPDAYIAFMVALAKEQDTIE